MILGETLLSQDRKFCIGVVQYGIAWWILWYDNSGVWLPPRHCALWRLFTQSSIHRVGLPPSLGPHSSTAVHGERMFHRWWLEKHYYGHNVCLAVKHLALAYLDTG